MTSSNIVDVNNLDYSIISNCEIQQRPKGNQGGRRKILYKNLINAFDIESTTISKIDQAVMYIWQFQLDDYTTIIGRTWEEFIKLLETIKEILPEDEWLVIYVHNLSYEFQFLKGIYEFSTDEVFAVDNRKILKCEMYNHFEFRCSYLHSNMSLSQYLDKMGVEHQKLSGEVFDYSKKRYSWTKLTDYELEYSINDVKGLVEALKIEMKHDNDNLYTIPLTSTGYVRRDAKLAMRQVSHNYVKDQFPDVELYNLLHECFRGGNSHANRYFSGQVLNNVHSFDRSSSYPDVVCNGDYPVSKFTKTDDISFDRLVELIDKRHKAVVFRLAVENIRLTNEFWGCPYLSRDKCRNVVNGVYDNGRILSADYLETSLTDVDLGIVLSEYTFKNAQPFDIYYARYGKLPRALIECTIDYYRKKTELKGVEGGELFYTKSKNKLNSIYGMMAQDPVKQNILFIDNEFTEDNKPVEDILEKSKKRAFLCYQWGVWTTALARLELEKGIRIVGENFVYCDTDSVKYLGEADFTKYNNEKKLHSKRSGSFATNPKGVTHYMGVFESEGTYEEFATLGAKKYCYRDNGKLHITIAGVNKKKGAEELEKHGGVKAFKEGFIFREGGGTESVYNDDPPVKEIEIQGHKVKITSNVVIKDSTYTLGITEEYARLLSNAKTYKKIAEELHRDLKNKPLVL